MFCLFLSAIILVNKAEYNIIFSPRGILCHQIIFTEDCISIFPDRDCKICRRQSVCDNHDLSVFSNLSFMVQLWLITEQRS